MQVAVALGGQRHPRPRARCWRPGRRTSARRTAAAASASATPAPAIQAGPASPLARRRGMTWPPRPGPMRRGCPVRWRSPSRARPAARRLGRLLDVDARHRRQPARRRVLTLALVAAVHLQHAAEGEQDERWREQHPEPPVDPSDQLHGPHATPVALHRRASAAARAETNTRGGLRNGEDRQSLGGLSSRSVPK
jgi:hypothetical protein